MSERTLNTQDLRRHPEYMEQSRGTLNKKLTLFIGYYRYIGIVKKLLLHYSKSEIPSNNTQDPDIDADIKHGYFEEPDYHVLAELSTPKRNALLKALVEVVCECYDTEWWYIILQRGIFLQKKGNWNTHTEYPKDKKDFPRTTGEFHDWIQLLGGSSFMCISTAFTFCQAEVTEKSAISRLIIRDLTNKIPENSKSRWLQNVTRHLAHYITEECAKVRDVAAPQIQEFWTNHAFELALATEFCTGRRKEGDTTPSIIWPTVIEEKMIRWRGFGPLIVKFNPTPLPSQRVIVPEAISMKLQFPDRRDVFFKHLQVNKQLPQLNQILVMRVIYHFEATAQKRDSRGILLPVFAANWGSVVLPGNESLSIFWDGPTAMLNYAKDVLKAGMRDKRTLTTAAKYNEPLWQNRINAASQSELFHYDPAEAALCDNGFQASGNHEAFRQAQQGIITTKFLTQLIIWRKTYVQRFMNGENMSMDKTKDIAKIHKADYTT